MKTCKKCLYEHRCPLYISKDEAERCQSFESKDDYVKVVRCENCTFRDKTKWCRVHAMYTNHDDYCSRAERKEGM